MIFGIGCDIVKISRLEKWVQAEDSYVRRFFNEKERLDESVSFRRKCESYAGKFAAKEAFSKALGTGISGFSLKDVFVVSDPKGKPVFYVTGDAEKLVEERCGKNYRIHVSISHEKEYAVAYAVIETGSL
ncbi:holo-ACP synthase [Treponema sp.]|uniref:holo-ACP synthase n=1 Tax=Treponema sp. TaxID=166 RepID=UPI00298ECB63|nr:holo-ACP synthase [Treponema sp.]MCQ2240617.1 holo-ACP synthase [Treponema sp.]